MRFLIGSPVDTETLPEVKASGYDRRQKVKFSAPVIFCVCNIIIMAFPDDLSVGLSKRYLCPMDRDLNICGQH